MSSKECGAHSHSTALQEIRKQKYIHRKECNHGVVGPSGTLVVVLPLPLAFGRGEVLAGCLLSRLWKKFCNTSCCVCPPVGLGVLAIDGEDGGRPTEPDCAVEAVNDAGRVLVAVLRDAIRRAAGASGTLELEAPPATSISDNARTTFGKLNVLLPSGPTIPADAPSRSAGLRKAPRGSRSGFLAFSS